MGYDARLVHRKKRQQLWKDLKSNNERVVITTTTNMATYDMTYALCSRNTICHEDPKRGFKVIYGDKKFHAP